MPLRGLLWHTLCSLFRPRTELNENMKIYFQKLSRAMLLLIFTVPPSAHGQSISVPKLEERALSFYEQVFNHKDPYRVFTPHDLNQIEGHSVEAFLAQLKKEEPTFLSRWTAIAPSRALQGGNQSAPRIVMVDASGRTLMTVTDAKRGKEKVEVAHLDLSGRSLGGFS